MRGKEVEKYPHGAMWAAGAMVQAGYKQVVPAGCRDVAQPRGGRREEASTHVVAVSNGRRQPHRLCERERRGPLIGTCRQWVFTVGDGDRIYTKHPPTSIGMLEMWPQSFCARECEESNPSKQPCRLVLPMYIVERFPFLSI